MPDFDRYRKVADAPDKGFLALQSSKILRIGLGDEILNKREEGWSISAIAKSFDLDMNTVKLFIDNWLALSPGQKEYYRKKMEEQNVWDIKKQMQRLYNRLETAADKLGDEPSMVHKEYMGEIRQTLATVKDAIVAAQKLELQKVALRIALEEIAKESKECRARIQARIRQVENIEYLTGGDI